MKFIQFLIISILHISCATDIREGEYTKSSVPIKVLYLTGGFYHDFFSQTQMLEKFIPHYINASVTTRNDFDNFSNRKIADGYDFVIMNFCHSKPSTSKIIKNYESVMENLANIIKKGKPVLAIHATVHSFKRTKKIFEKWVKVLGVNSQRHDKARDFKVNKIKEHPITKYLPKRWTSKNDELYNIISEEKSLIRLIEAYSIDSNKKELVFWINKFGKGTVFATTIGHSFEAFKDVNFQQLITNTILAGTNKLNKNGKAILGYLGHQKGFDFLKVKKGEIVRHKR